MISKLSVAPRQVRDVKKIIHPPAALRNSDMRNVLRSKAQNTHTELINCHHLNTTSSKRSEQMQRLRRVVSLFPQLSKDEAYVCPKPVLVK